MQFLFKKRKAPEKALGITLVSLIEATLISAILFANRFMVSIFYTFAPTRLYLKRMFAANFQSFLSPISLLAILYIAYYSIVEYFLFLREFYDGGTQGVDRVSSIIETGFSIENFLYPMIALGATLSLLYGISLVLIQRSDAWRRYLVCSAASSISASLFLFLIFVSYGSLPVEDSPGQNTLNISLLVFFWLASAGLISSFIVFQVHFRAYTASKMFMRASRSWQLYLVIALTFCFLTVLVVIAVGDLETLLLIFTINWIGIFLPPAKSEALGIFMSSVLTISLLATPLFFAAAGKFQGRDWRNALLQAGLLVTASFYVFAVNTLLVIFPVFVYENPIQISDIFPRVEGPPNFRCSAFISDKEDVYFYLTNSDSDAVIIWPRSLEMVQSSAGGIRRSPDRLLFEQIEHADLSMPILLKPLETIVLIFASTSRDEIKVLFETDYQTSYLSSRLSVCSSAVHARPFE